MTLPILNVPTYNVTIPSTKKSVKIRPFLVKEEKLLLIAMEEDNYDAIFGACKQIIANCTFGAVDVEKLKSYDLEYLILQLRIKSRGPEVVLSFKCLNKIDDKECGNPVSTKINLEQIKLIETENHINKIMLTETLGVVMKDPTVDDLASLRSLFDTADISILYDSIPKFIDCIFEGELVYTEYTTEEMKEFMESLTTDQFKKIQDFFSSLPKLKANIHLKCAKCNHEENVEVEGLQSFLD